MPRNNEMLTEWWEIDYVDEDNNPQILRFRKHENAVAHIETIEHRYRCDLNKVRVSDLYFED